MFLNKKFKYKLVVDFKERKKQFLNTSIDCNCLIIFYFWEINFIKTKRLQVFRKNFYSVKNNYMKFSINKKVNLYDK